MSIHPGEAQRGEVCEFCGYPFDDHERIYVVNSSHPCCSKVCSIKLEQSITPSEVAEFDGA